MRQCLLIMCLCVLYILFISRKNSDTGGVHIILFDTAYLVMLRSLIKIYSKIGLFISERTKQAFIEYFIYSRKFFTHCYPCVSEAHKTCLSAWRITNTFAIPVYSDKSGKISAHLELLINACYYSTVTLLILMRRN